jgi:hypothetical protein
LTSGTLEEVQDVEFDETKGFQDKNENLDDVRGIQLSNAMKNMDVGELRPRQVYDEDDQVQVLSNSNMQVDTNQASSSGSHDNMQDQHVASTSSQPNDHASASNQVLILQPTNIARDHPLDTMKIFLELYKQDQDCLHFVSISYLYHSLNQRR